MTGPLIYTAPGPRHSEPNRRALFAPGVHYTAHDVMLALSGDIIVVSRRGDVPACEVRALWRCPLAGCPMGVRVMVPRVRSAAIMAHEVARRIETAFGAMPRVSWPSAVVIDMEETAADRELAREVYRLITSAPWLGRDVAVVRLPYWAMREEARCPVSPPALATPPADDGPAYTETEV